MKNLYIMTASTALFVGLLLFLSYALSQPEERKPATIVNAACIALKTPYEVRQILGVHEGQPYFDDYHSSETRAYRDSSIFLIYTDGRATYLKVFLPAQTQPYDPAALCAVGLHTTAPMRYADERSLSWSEICYDSKPFQDCGSFASRVHVYASDSTMRYASCIDMRF